MKDIILFSSAAAFVLTAAFFYVRIKRLGKLSDKLSVQNAALSKHGEEIKEKLETVMGSLTSPAVLLDGNGTVSFANLAAKELTGSPEMEGHNYLEFFKEADFIETVISVHKNLRPEEKEIHFGGRILLASFSPTGKTGDLFISCKDFTAEKELEKIKKDIVTNMSHELKTPLTAIKGYAETLAEEISGEQKKYLDIIGKHTDRLISIVNDILSLSELEETGKSEFKIVDIKEVMSEILKMFDGKIRDKGLSVTMEIDEKNRHFEGDRLKIEELFINLIDNAVRYTDNGGITVKTFRNNSCLVISIKDTGIGIPEKNLPRIFERFYVVDKSRSKETGGTGLGLSIVKHIVILHNGAIDIKSSAGAGTEVILSFPLSANPS